MTLITAFAVSALALADAMTASAIFKDRDKFDKKPVELTATVSKFEQRTSKKGNKYFVFKVIDGKNELNIYGKGELTPAVKDGDKVTIKGIYRKEKNVGKFVSKDEIDVSAVEGKNYGVKKAK